MRKAEAEIEEAVRVLQRYGVGLDIARGTTDEGDEWFSVVGPSGKVHYHHISRSRFAKKATCRADNPNPRGDFLNDASLQGA